MPLVVARAEAQRDFASSRLDGKGGGVSTGHGRHDRRGWEVEAQQPVTTPRVHAAVEPVVAGAHAMPDNRYAVLTRLSVDGERVHGTVHRAGERHAIIAAGEAH